MVTILLLCQYKCNLYPQDYSKNSTISITARPAQCIVNVTGNVRKNKDNFNFPKSDADVTENVVDRNSSNYPRLAPSWCHCSFKNDNTVTLSTFLLHL
jgi:hypothetical protein